MALELKDVRVKIDADWHAALSGVAESDMCDIGDRQRREASAGRSEARSGSQAGQGRQGARGPGCARATARATRRGADPGRRDARPRPGPAAGTTMEDVRTALQNLGAVKGRDSVLSLLGEHGAQTLPTLKPEKYAAVVAKAAALVMNTAPAS